MPEIVCICENFLYISHAIHKLLNIFLAFYIIKSCFTNVSFPIFVLNFLKPPKIFFPSSDHFHSTSVHVNQFNYSLNNQCYLYSNGRNPIISPFLYNRLIFHVILRENYCFSSISDSLSNTCFISNPLRFITSRDYHYAAVSMPPAVYRRRRLYLSDASILICRYSLISFTQLSQPTLELLSIKS